jgi:hypothetical protein
VIPVVPQPEPNDFDRTVRRSGQAFLRRVPHPTADEFRKKNFWKEALPSLQTAYKSICAYSSCWVPGSCSVDHFHPKTTHPQLAYEWSNYRLANAKINNNKGNSNQVLDAFHIQHGWFILDIATLWVKPEPTLKPAIFSAVQTTVTVLRLNDDDWVQMRFEIFSQYRDGACTVSFLQRYYPFMASEITRQQVKPK